MLRRGRPMKYAEWIRVLDNETIYAGSTVVRHGEEKGLFELAEFKYEDRTKVRNALNQFAVNHFSGKTDGMVSMEQGMNLKGWYGWRWKDSLPSYHFKEEELKEIRRCKLLAKISFPPAKRTLTAWSHGLMRFIWRKKRAILMTGLALGTFALGTLVSMYSEGLRVLDEEGPRAALEYFRSAAFKRTDYKAEYGQAWAKYVIGDFVDAENDCYRLLRYRDMPEPLQGNCYYLLGYIQMRTNRLELAKESFQIAGDIYQSNRKWPHLYQTSLALGEIAMEQGYLDEAEAIFQEAFALNSDVNRDLGHYYHLQATLAFRQENYERALQLARKSLFEFKKRGQKGEEADVLSDIGFYLILIGAYHQGFEKTMEAQELIQRTGNDTKYYFNLVNFLILKKCKDEPIAPIEKQLKGRISEKGENRLQYYVDFVHDWECMPEVELLPDSPGIPEMVGAGTEQPPPDGG